MLRISPRCYAARTVFTSASVLAIRHFSVNGRPSGQSLIREAIGPVDVEAFRHLSFLGDDKPTVIRSQCQPEPDAAGNGDSETPSVLLPALTKWFTSSRQGDVDLSPYLRQYSALVLCYELLLPSSTELSLPQSNLSDFISWLSKSSDPLHQSLHTLLESHIASSLTDKVGYTDSDVRFIRFDAPLALLAAGLQFNRQQPSPKSRLSQLYIAQSSLSVLPQELQADMPTPLLVRQAGKGDVYASSVWLGLEPTYTPWHRDPNPNLFCQLCGSKVFRLLPSHAGDRLFREVQARLGKAGSSRIRGEEMMQGPERQALMDAVWGERAPEDMIEVVLKPRDVLFIRQGWWHSVKSVGGDGGLNGSVNWWFR
ncbi:hypothetical protein VTK56DRAFT_9688 [Thermocarpiscus australiensis]